MTSPTLATVFEEQCRRDPERIAVCYDGRHVSYAELKRRADDIARTLHHGVTSAGALSSLRDTPIAVHVARGVDMIAAVLGVLKAGGAYVPSDPGVPADRVSRQITDARCAALVTTGDLLERLPRNGAEPAPVIDLDHLPTTQENSSGPLGHGAHARGTSGQETDLAYVIYTSGTTGRPKGVMVEHRSVLNLARSRRTDFGIDADSVILQFSPISFDASVCEIFSALMNGGRLVVATEEERRDPSALVELMRREHVTVATMLPSLAAQLVHDHRVDIPTLKTLVVAGEPCTEHVLRAWVRDGVRVVNAYGPTETTVCATVHEFRPGDVPTTIGRAIANCRVHLLDEHLVPVAPGCVGEVCVSGVGLARGYLGRPEETATRFVHLPSSGDVDSEAPTRIYRTGDLARSNASGDLEFLGRDDAQVKIRGHRIELSEIEQHLLNIDGIEQVCVTAQMRPQDVARSARDPHRARVLVVHHVGQPAGGIEEIRRTLAARLPDYMVPRLYRRLDSFSLTHNGKIDKTRLPSVFDDPAREHTPPRNATEARLHEVWTGLLGTKSIGVDDDFFDAGGDSLLVAALAARIRAELGHRVPVETIYRHPTVAGLARALTTVEAPAPVTVLQAGGDRPPLFLVHPSMIGTERYRQMTDWLAPDQPVYGIESHNREHLRDPERDLSRLARRYLDHIRSIRPRGPYALGGYSAGGNIAQEMACQLEAAGEPVLGLYLIDSMAPGSPTTGTIGRREAEEFLDYFGLGGPEDTELVDLATAEMRLLFDHRPRALSQTDVVLVKATRPVEPSDRLSSRHIAERLLSSDSVTNRWDRLARRIVVHEVEADHTTIMEKPHLPRVCRLVQDHLDHCRPRVHD